MTEIRRQREELTQMIEEAADIEGMKEALDQEGIIGEINEIKSELQSFGDEAATISDDLDEVRNVARAVKRPMGYTREPRRATKPREVTPSDEGETKD